MAFRSLRALTLAFLALFLTATMATSFITYTITRRTIVHLVDKRIAHASSEAAGVVRPPDRDAVIARIGHLMDRRETGDIGFLLVDREARRLTGNIALRRILPIGYSTLNAGDHVAGLSEGRALVRPIGGGMILTTIAETEPFDRENATHIQIYLFGFGAIILIVVGGILIFGRIVSRRIRELRRTVDAIIDGDISQRVPVSGSGDTFDDQAQAFNRMLDRIAGLMEAIHSVSSDIAHDLRTPLARLHGELRRIAQQPESAAIRLALEGVIARSDDLLAMFAAILRIVEIEGGDRRAAFALVDLTALAADLATMMQPVADDGGRSIVLVPSAGAARIRGDSRLLTQLIVNLVENGLRHTPPGSQIAVGVAATASDVILRVSDNGPGIEAGQRAHALRRFGRLDESRGTVGHGLGLAMVDAIARLHDGGIALLDARPGLLVEITLPMASPP